MEPIIITKTLHHEKENFEIRYEGMPLGEGVNLENIYHLLELFFNNYSHVNMLQNVNIMRTIMQSYQEKLLDIYYEDNSIFERITYQNGVIVNFQKRCKTGKKYSLQYQSEDNRNIFGLGVYTNLIKELSESQPEKLEEYDIMIMELYKLFYEEDIDFTKEEVNLKVQTMMSILAQFHILVNNYQNFILTVPNRIPVIPHLLGRIQRLYFLGEVVILEEDIDLPDCYKNLIKTIGKMARQNITDNVALMEELIKLNKIIYAGKYNLHKEVDVEKIAEFSHYSKEEVKSCIKLVHKIDQKINKD